MSRSETLYALLCNARIHECELFEQMNAGLEAVQGNKKAEEVMQLTYIPKLERATELSSNALAEWKASLELPFKKDVSHCRNYFNHPERRDDEVFLGNATTSGLAGYGRYTTARIGKAVVDGLGDRPTEDTVFPIFVSIEEALEKSLFGR